MVHLAQKIEKAILNPKRFITYIFCMLQNAFQKKYKWGRGADQNIRRKEYKSYDEYVVHQKSKLNKIRVDLIEYDEKYFSALKERLANQGMIQPNMVVLCLAARIGTEVKSFLSLGCFAVGIDLNPGQENKYVLYGDFHDIQFPSHSIDAVFCNSIDHVLDFHRFITEVKRVLKPGGLFILEIVRGEEEGYLPGYYEVTVWKRLEDGVRLFTQSGFSIIKRDNFTYPWGGGQHISFRLLS